MKKRLKYTLHFPEIKPNQMKPDDWWSQSLITSRGRITLTVTLTDVKETTL